MNRRRVEIAVIGAGSAGLTAFRAAKKHSDSVVLIEGGAYGTTCARVGCMPSKLLIAAADAAHAAQQAAGFGINTAISIDGAAVMDRVRRERDRFVGFVVESTENIPEAERIRGYARFIDDHQLQIDDHSIVEVERIVIATGSSPVYPQEWKKLGDRLIVNDDIFDWKDLPDSVAVIGTGVIGLELGQALGRLGVKTFLFGKGESFGPLTDPVVSAAAREAIATDVNLQETNILGMERQGDAVAIDFIDADGNQQQIQVDFVVAATGRRPNLTSLALENTSLPLDADGIPVFDEHSMQVGDSPVFIAGDVNNDRPLLHEAADEGRIAGDNAGRYPDVIPGFRSSGLAVVFSDPQIAMVGDTFKSLQGKHIVVGEVSFDDQGRSRVMLQNRGHLRVYADAQSGRFLGAEMAGPRAEHLAHLLAWSHQSGHDIETMLQMPFYHPVIEEGLRTALRDARQKLQPQLLQAV